MKLARLKADLDQIIHHEEDQVLFISLGPESDDQVFRIESIGQPYQQRSRVTVV